MAPLICWDASLSGFAGKETLPPSYYVFESVFILACVAVGLHLEF